MQMPCFRKTHSVTLQLDGNKKQDTFSDAMPNVLSLICVCLNILFTEVVLLHVARMQPPIVIPKILLDVIQTVIIFLHGGNANIWDPEDGWKVHLETLLGIKIQVFITFLATTYYYFIFPSDVEREYL